MVPHKSLVQMVPQVMERWRWREIERDGKRWGEMERHGETWGDMGRDLERWGDI